DFAGGTVVHINAGISALVLVVIMGRRARFSTPHTPHNIPITVLGTALLWFGWFGFNGGAATTIEQGGLIWINTLAAPAAGMRDRRPLCGRPHRRRGRCGSVLRRRGEEPPALRRRTRCRGRPPRRRSHRHRDDRLLRLPARGRAGRTPLRRRLRTPHRSGPRLPCRGRL